MGRAREYALHPTACGVEGCEGEGCGVEGWRVEGCEGE